MLAQARFSFLSALLFLSTVIGFSPVDPEASPAAQAGLEVSRLVPVGVKVDGARHDGRDAVRLLEADDRREGGMALIDGVTFQDGVVAIDVAGRRGPHAVPSDRGFIGVAFRVQPGGDRFEYVYLRPDNGRAEDQVLRNHSTQYASHPDFPWPRMRKEFPERYESYVDLEYGAWTRMRIEVAGARLRLYVNDAPQPVLIVNDLKHGAGVKGGVGLWIGAGTEGFFSNVQVSPAP